MKKMDSAVIIFGLPIFGNSKNQLLNFLESKVTKPGGLISVFTPNPEQLVIAHQNSDFFKILKDADVLIPDGVGLIWASKFLSRFGKTKPLKERITGVDLVNDLLKISRQNKLKTLVIGGQGYERYGAETVLPRAQAGKIAVGKLYKLKPLGDQVYWLPAYKKVKQVSSAEEEQLQQVIEEIKPELVLVAFGAPQQETWINSHQQLLAKNSTRLVMAVGGAIDFKLGKTKRAPRWIQAIGLEWLYRLILQPWRWKRQLRLIKFVFLVFGEIFR